MTERKADWANEIAEKIEDDFQVVFTGFDETVAAALRKAKADGVRLIIPLIIESVRSPSVPAELFELLNAELNSVADKIEKGQA